MEEELNGDDNIDSMIMMMNDDDGDDGERCYYRCYQ